MIPGEILSKIGRIVGRNHLITEGEILADYGMDATRLSAMPDGVVFPRTAGEVSQILHLATRHRFPVVPRGAGTGMSGGAVPVNGGLVMDMTRFDRILSIDEDNLVCKVEPGVVTARLQEAVEAVGLFYPPDPASLEVSTIGGNVAECAGGLRAVKYGVTRDYVLGLTIVLPTGKILNTGVETMKGVAGYDLTRLIVGSEGTLAVVTAVTLRLIPRPAAHRTMLSFFPDVSSAARTVSGIIRNRITPTILEFMDRLCIDCVRDEMGLPIPFRAGAMLLIEVDGERAEVTEGARRVRGICEKEGALEVEESMGAETSERLWEARRNASPSLYRLRPHKISEDVVVPRGKLPELLSFLDETGRRHGLPIPAFGHAGDGNLHVNIMFDSEAEGEADKARAIVRLLFEKVIRMGGTITGEHGIGITKAPYLEMEIPRAGLELMTRIKAAFDPAGILNPGKIFTERTGGHPEG